MNLLTAFQLAARGGGASQHLTRQRVVAGPRGPVLVDGEAGVVKELLDGSSRTWHLPAGCHGRLITEAAKRAESALSLAAGAGREVLRYAWGDSLGLLRSLSVPWAPSSLAFSKGYWFVNTPLHSNAMTRVDDDTGQLTPFEPVRVPPAGLDPWRCGWAHAWVDADDERVYCGFLTQPLCIVTYDREGRALDILGPGRVSGRAGPLDRPLGEGRVAIHDICVRPTRGDLYALIAGVPDAGIAKTTPAGILEITTLPNEALEAQGLVWLDREHLAICTPTRVLVYRDIP